MEEPIKNDPKEMKISSDASWLCRIFQKNKLTVQEKQQMIREMTADHRKKGTNNG